MAVFVALAAIATAGWVHREQLGLAEMVAPIQKAINQSWLNDREIVDEQHVEETRQMNDEELRELAKFLSNANKDSNEENEEPEVPDVPEIPMTEVSIAPYHDISKKGSLQKEGMIRYMQFDDGYTTCINLPIWPRCWNSNIPNS